MIANWIVYLSEQKRLYTWYTLQCHWLCISDICGERLAIAKKMGASHIFKIDPTVDTRSTAGQIVRALGENPDVTIECSGAESSLQTGIYVNNYCFVHYYYYIVVNSCWESIHKIHMHRWGVDFKQSLCSLLLLLYIC